MWDFLLLLQEYLLWALPCVLLFLVIIICAAALVSAKDHAGRDKGDESPTFPKSTGPSKSVTHYKVVPLDDDELE